jgi:hypothetical protein
MKNISEHAEQNVIIYLVGNKIDMAEKRVKMKFPLDTNPGIYIFYRPLLKRKEKRQQINFPYHT